MRQTTVEKTILILDGCTANEAERHLQHGTVVFDDFEEHFDGYMEEFGVKDDELEGYRRMVEDKIPLPDWEIVPLDGKNYYIMYLT